MVGVEVGVALVVQESAISVPVLQLVSVNAEQLFGVHCLCVPLASEQEPTSVIPVGQEVNTL